MQIILVKYIQLVCVTLSFSNQMNCDNFLLQNDNDDHQIYETTACSARCLKDNDNGNHNNNNNLTLDDCFANCKAQTININNLKKIHENLDIKFLCRDSTSLAFEIIHRDFNITTTTTTATTTNDRTDVSTTTTEQQPLLSKLENNKDFIIYILKVHEAHSPKEQIMILSNLTFIKLEKLKPNTTYNVTATVIHSTSEFSLIANNVQFTTLKSKYEPGQVTKISLIKYEENEIDKRYLKGVINWIPATDMTCYYDILFYPSQGTFDMAAIEIRDIKQLYTYTIEPFLFGTEYTIGIRSINTKDFNKESTLKYLTIETPSCLEWNQNDLTICPPLKPEGLMANDEILSNNNEYSINITWTKPTIHPDYYIVKIFDLDLKSEYQPNSITKNVSKDQNYIFLPCIELTGHEYEVYLIAYSIGGNSTAMIAIPLKKLQITDKHHSLKLVLAIILPLTFFAFFSTLTFIFCHRRARTKRYKERCKYFEELEKKAPMDPNSNFEFSTKNLSIDQLTQLQYDLEDKLFFNDHMEVNRTDIELFEILGEGAFGLVRRGLLKISEKNDIEVAVKMLKDHPSVDDFRGFRREIEVMKSVGKHENIVGILGHCTKDINDMMLLTEYCSRGNLLNFLRAEWNYINKIIYIQKTTTTTTAAATLPTSISNSPVQVVVVNQSSIIDLKDLKQQQKQKQNENENLFNFDSSFVDKISLKYKNINHKSENDVDNKQQQNDDDDDDENFIGGAVVNNQSYDYSCNYNLNINTNKLCTNFCKCHVDIVNRQQQQQQKPQQQQNDKQQCLNNINCNNCRNNSNNNNFNCNNCNNNNQQKNENLSSILLTSSSSTSSSSAASSSATILLNEIHISKNCECKIINNNNNSNSNNNNIKNNSSECDPLMVENKGYYKLMKDNNNHNEINENLQNNCHEPLTCRDLLLIAKQIALGMEFLSKCKVVHRDLAARNVLVCQDRTVKIADFGLSRDVYQENVYKKTGNGKLPIKWLALESMTHQIYTTQSDVWSYGILLYEIATLGGTPYPAIPTNRLVSILKSGYRMERPKNCSKSLYNLMASCWRTVPSERPTFTEICQTLDDMLDVSTEYEIENLSRSEIDKSIKIGSNESYLNPII